jgi:hypothetical protein
MLSIFPFLVFFAAALIRTLMASSFASKAILSISKASVSARYASMACAIRRASGFIALSMAGDFFAEGKPTIPPHRFGTISQSSFALGLMAQRAPMIAPSSTSAAAAMKSGGHGMRSASSMIQARRASGSIVFELKAGTGCSGA